MNDMIKSLGLVITTLWNTYTQANTTLKETLNSVSSSKDSNSWKNDGIGRTGLNKKIGNVCEMHV